MVNVHPASRPCFIFKKFESLHFGGEGGANVGVARKVEKVNRDRTTLWDFLVFVTPHFGVCLKTFKGE